MANGKNTFRQAVDLALQGNWPEARQILQRIVEQKKDDDQVWLWLADSYTSDEARLAILQYGLRRHPDSDHLMRALELQLERMNSTAAVEPVPSELQASESEVVPEHTTDLSVEEIPPSETELAASEPQDPYEADLTAAATETQSTAAATETQSTAADEEQQAAERWQADNPLPEGESDESHPQTDSLDELASSSTTLNGETPSEPELQPLPAPETLQEPAPAVRAGTGLLRQVLVTAAVIILIIVLAYGFTRIW